MGSSEEKTELEPWEQPLKFIGFRIKRLDSLCVQGSFVVSDNSCQPFKVLHGGVSAMIAESLASAGAAVASGYRRVAGVQLTINHLKAAPIGTEIFVSAKPVHAGKRLHVWDVTFIKSDDKSSPSVSEDVSDGGILIAVSRVTLMVYLSDEVLDIKYQNQSIKSKL